MKTVIFLLVLGVYPLICFSQDTLVDSRGFAFPVSITGIGNDFITYVAIDTSIKDQTIVPRSSIIFIKHESGETEQFYKNDTLITKEGLFIPCKILEIDQSTLIYFTYKDKFIPPTMLLKSDLLLIKLQDGTKELTTQQSSLNDFDYYSLGVDDANVYYKANTGMIVSEVLMGYTSLYVLPIIAGTLIAYTKPMKLENVTNPNNSLLSSNPSYKKGYESIAKQKKVKKATVAYFSGLLGFVATIVIAVAIFW